MNTLPDNNLNVNIKSYVLDPLTVIIKLAILGNKPVGTIARLPAFTTSGSDKSALKSNPDEPSVAYCGSSFFDLLEKTNFIF